mgnify:CR=1 FL=1
MDKMKITVFSDPVCTWCWGSVPVIRALAYRYGGQIEFDYVMSGMIEDISSYSNRRLSVGGDIALSNRNIHQHWLSMGCRSANRDSICSAKNGVRPCHRTMPISPLKYMSMRTGLPCRPMLICVFCVVCRRQQPSMHC